MSNSTSVLDGTKIDLSKITFSSIRRNDNGSKSVRVSYDGGPLTIQTPLMPIPWNLNPPYSDKNANKKGKDNEEEEDQEQENTVPTTGRTKWSLQMTFRDRENNRRLQRFYENMKALDDLFAKKTVESRAEWFDDDEDYESERDAFLTYKKIFKPGVRQRKNKTTGEAYPPCIEPKVTCNDGEFACNCFSMNREKYDKPMNKLQLRGTEGEGIIRLTNFYVQDSRCGPTWALMRLRADESEGSLGEFGFIDVGDDEDNEKTTNVEIHTSGEEDNGEEGEEEGEEEEGDAEEEEPEPEPVKPKTTRRKTGTTTTRRKKTVTAE